MEYTTLSNDVQVPLLGLGTFMIGPEDTEKSVYAALKMGYRLIDTANAYVNEEAVGRGLRRALEEGLVKREDIFISTKLWPTLYEKAGAVDKTLERLGVDYVDLLFIHQPAGTCRVCGNDAGRKCFFADLRIHRQCSFAVCIPESWRKEN